MECQGLTVKRKQLLDLLFTVYNMAIRSDHSLFHRTLKNSFSGTIAGIAVCFVGHPFDTLKVRLQTQPIHNPVYRGVTDCFLKTLRWEGIGGLYKGVGEYIFTSIN